MVNVSDVVPFSGMVAAPNAFVMLGGAATIRLAVLLVAPVPPLVELTAPVVLVTVPDCVPVTFTTIVQVAPGVAMLPPVRLIEVEFAAAVTVPPHVLLTPGVAATWRPLVNVSLNAIPVSDVVFTAGFVMVKVTVVVPFNGIDAAPNALEIVGGATIFKVAVLLVVPVPPSVEVIAPVVFTASPAAVPVTLTVSVQEVFLVTVAPERLITPVPAVAVTVPPQVFTTPGVAETTSVPVVEGSVSLKATPLRSTVAFGLLMVKVRVVVPFSGTLAAPNAFAMVGGPTTVIDAFAVLPVPAFVEVACTLLFFTPAVVPCTSTVTVQLEFGASDWPLRLTEPEPGVAVIVPVQLPPTFAGVATTSPAGRLSVNPAPVMVRFWLLLLSRVKVRLVVPFSGIVAAPNAFTICGGLMTVRFADEIFPLPASVDRICTLLL
jgi:hypothetical protein